MLELVIKLIAILIILIGVTLVYDARIITKKVFGFGDQNEATSGLKILGAVLSIILLITKIRKTSEYIPFGPFIVIASFISIYVPFETIKMILMEIFTLGMYKG